MEQSAAISAPGKIILSGEYAVAFGKPGAAIPSSLALTVAWQEDRHAGFSIDWEAAEDSREWLRYLERIIALIGRHLTHPPKGVLSIGGSLPLGKGMGSSTALVIAVTRALFGANASAAGIRESRLKEIALAIEDAVNPGHSGIDFAVIWEGQPLVFERGKRPVSITAPALPRAAYLIDTGPPHEQTKDLVAWVRSRESEFGPIFDIIGRCTERLLSGENPLRVFHDHHLAQVALGVVPERVQQLIERIEQTGGAAKVIGAGAKTGGAGMVLVIGVTAEGLREIRSSGYPLLPV